MGTRRIPTPSPVSRRLRTALAVVCTVSGLTALGPATAGAASPHNCDASALRGAVLGQAALEPVTANRGKTVCDNATGGLTGLLPAPLAASAVVARTIVSGDPSRPDQQSALAFGGVADVRVSALPELPIALPIDTVLQNLPTLPAIAVPALLQPLLGASLTLDIHPALTALLPSGRLPNLDLVSAQAAIAYAGARCNAGKAESFGIPQVTGLKVLGQDVVLSASVEQALSIIDSASVDPSSLDPIALLPASAVTTILGSPILNPILQGVLKPTIQAALDALPTVTLPAALAQVKVTAGPKTIAGATLTQQALRIEARIAGQQIADVTLGEARVALGSVDCTPPASTPATSTTPTASELALQCTTRRLVLQDVVPSGSRVILFGAADRKLAGKTVAIRFLATGKIVALVKVREDGSFRTTAPLPSRAVRSTNAARYQASIGREKSLDLKLERRMVISNVTVKNGKVTISGRVVRPLTRPASVITVTRRVSCKRSAVVARIEPRNNGTFRVTVDAPEGQLAAVYRLGTFVRKTPGNPKRFPTFTLPRAVDLS